MPEARFVSGPRLLPPFPEGMELATFAMGCFWGAERKLWEVDGVYSTMVGYAGGPTENPTYREVCSGRTGHTEVVQVVFDPKRVSYQDLLKVFWENHDPTQGMRQGNESATHYRSPSTRTARRSGPRASARRTSTPRGAGPVWHHKQVAEGRPPSTTARVPHSTWPYPTVYCVLLTGVTASWRDLRLTTPFAARWGRCAAGRRRRLVTRRSPYGSPPPSRCAWSL